MEIIGITFLTIACILGIFWSLEVYLCASAFGSVHKADYIVSICIFAISCYGIYYIYFEYLSISISATKG